MLLSHRDHLRVTASAAGAAQPVVPRSVLAGSSGSSAGWFTTRNAALSCSRLGLQQQQPLVSPSAPTARPIGYGFTSSSSSSTALAPSVGSRQSTVMRSFLGVGAPEAILVAVVALVVFGPKGLADAAKSVGQTLRAFQPTIKEVVEVSQEIKGTLEQELGLDELRNAATMRPTPRPMPPSTSSTSTSSGDETAAAAAGSGADAGEASSISSSNPGLRAISEDMAKQLDPDIELKRAMSEQAAWGGQPPAAADPVAAVAAAAAPPAAAAAGGADSKAAAGKDLSTLSLEELEAELARRKK